jgi:tetratricopeptide (TPR) repeat protein
MAAGDLAAAANLLSRARACLSEGDPALVGVLFDLVECLTAVGDVNAARTALADVERLVLGQPESPAPIDDAAQARVTVARCELRMLSEPGRLRDDLATVQEAVVTLSQAGDPAALAHALIVLGRALALFGRLADAERELDRALIQARQSDDAARARQVLLQLPLVALWGPQPVTKANGRLIDTLRVLRLRPGNRGVEAEVLRCMGLMEAMRGRIEPARSLLDSAQQVFRDLGSPIGLGEVELSLGLVELMSGNTVPAFGALEAAYQRFNGLGVAGGAGRAAGWLAESKYRQGDLNGAASWAHTAAGGHRSRDAFVWLGVQAKVAARSGNHEAAQILAREAVALVEDTDALVDRADALMNQAQVQRLCGHANEAETSARRAAALYTTKGHVVGAARAASEP